MAKKSKPEDWLLSSSGYVFQFDVQRKSARKRRISEKQKNDFSEKTKKKSSEE